MAVSQHRKAFPAKADLGFVNDSAGFGRARYFWISVQTVDSGPALNCAGAYGAAWSSEPTCAQHQMLNGLKLNLQQWPSVACSA